jgi:dolichol-phosphate mannosyltransferase
VQQYSCHNGQAGGINRPLSALFATRRGLRLSILIPAHNEADNILPLLAEIDAALARPGLSGFLPAEIIVVDDGSTDATAAELKGARLHHHNLRVLRHDERSGQSAALQSGVRAARGEWIATLDGDGQNDPADLERLAAALAADPGLALASGLREKRRDSFSRRFASRFANKLRQSILQDGCTDSACGLKIFRRDAFLALPGFDGMHRFMPALFLSQGHRAVYLPISHRPRQRGVSKVTNAGRAAVGITDLFGVWWLKRRARRPVVSEERS